MINTRVWLLDNSLFLERCSLSLTSPVNNISSHIYMNILTIFLCYVFVISFLPMNISHFSIPKDHLENSHRAFVSYRNVFICLAVCCMCNQLISAFACRSIDILYNIRFTSMIILQTIGFFACLLFAFFLGIKYASLNHGYYWEIIKSSWHWMCNILNKTLIKGNGISFLYPNFFVYILNIVKWTTSIKLLTNNN